MDADREGQMIFSCPDPALDQHFAAKLLTLQHEAYALEAELIGDDRLPPLLEDEEAMAAPRLQWCTAWDGVDLLGAVSWHEHDDHIDIDRVMVSPSVHRRGIASALLGHVRDDAHGRPMVVSTGRDNAPAVTLYLKHGFAPVEDQQVPPGIWITRLRSS